MGIGEGFPRRAWEHPLLSLVTLLSLAPTLLWMTTTLRLSALNQVSMALQMLQILSRAGAWWSGQPKSNTWETTEPNSHNEAQLRSGQRARHLIYLWIELTDVATLFTEVEELKENRQIESISTLRKVCGAFQKLLLMRMFRQKQFTLRKKSDDWSNPGLQFYIYHLYLLFVTLIFTPNDKNRVDQHAQFLTLLCLWAEGTNKLCFRDN